MNDSRKPTDQSLSQTLAAIVRGLEPTWSWSKCRETIEAGRVLVDGEPVLDHAARLSVHSAVTISNQRTTPKKELPALEVYHHDSQIIVVEKVSGIESVPFETKTNQKDRPRIGSQHKSELTLIELSRLWLVRKENTKIPPLRIVHRIDKGTSGIVVFARTQSAEQALGQQFRQHSIARHYLAVTHGVPSTGTIRSILIPDRGDGYRGSVNSNHPSKNSRERPGKEAITHVKVLESTPSKSYSLVECRLETGRTHQIRIHLSESGHPLCGDAVYRKPKAHAAAIPDHSGSNRLLLHAAELGFVHPTSGKDLLFASPLREDYLQIWNSIKEN